MTRCPSWLSGTALHIEAAFRCSAPEFSPGTRFEDPSPSRRRGFGICSPSVHRPPLWSNDPDHPPSTPWGMRMSVRRSVADAYIEEARTNPRRLQLDPVGDQPGYGGDTDMGYTGCAIGLGMGVFPEPEGHTPDPQTSLHERVPDPQSRSPRVPSDVVHDRPLRGRRRPPSLRAHAGSGYGGPADALGREILAAEDRSRAAARRAIATGVDSRPITHR